MTPQETDELLRVVGEASRIARENADLRGVPFKGTEGFLDRTAGRAALAAMILAAEPCHHIEEHGAECAASCPFACSGAWRASCRLGWAVGADKDMETFYYHVLIKPGPLCPAAPEAEKMEKGGG